MFHKRVKFKGVEYWLHESDYCNGLISPINHYSEDGELLADPFNDSSFAILEGENIMQFGYKIGNVSELEELK